jgi:DNA-binding transcriptional regulator YhcF (GntR family)
MTATGAGCGSIMLVIDQQSVVPPYEQILDQIAALVRDRRLAPGARLPTVRRLADDLGLAPNTVARAYRELERHGVVETRGRRGTFVATAADNATRQAQQAALDYAARVKQLGIPPNEALQLVRQALQSLTI